MHPSAWFCGCLAAIVAGVTLAFAAPALAESVTIPAAGSLPAIPGNLQRPAGPGPFPAVLVLAGCDGVSSLENKTATELVKQGYVALVLDVLAPQGLKNACTAGAGTIATSARFAYVSLGWLAAQPGVIPDHLGVIGFSMGAIEILGLVDPLTPHVPPPGLRAAVAYYPDCAQRRADVSVPLQILDGDADDWTPAPPCAALAQAAAAAGKTVQITTYPGATHAFNLPGAQRTYLGHTLRYDGDADRDSDAKALSFLATYLR
jgi:dienelactone hydrolase